MLKLQSLVSFSALLLLLLLLTIATCNGETVINIYPNAPPGDQSNLLRHLCNESEQIKSNTVLVLAPGVYEIEDGNSCIVSDISNLTIRGTVTNGTDNYSELNCPFNFLGRNFIFLNVSNLILEDLVISSCGRYIPDGLPSYVNDSYIYFGQNQKAVLLFAQVTNLRLENCVLAHSFGYGLVGVNLQGETILNRIRIVGSDNMKHPLCFSYETTLSCSGSGAVFLYSDPTSVNNTFQVTDTSLVISNSTFDYNKNSVPAVHYLVVFSLALSPYYTQRLVLIGGSGISLYTSQRSYLTDIVIQDSTINNNIGETSSLLFVLFNSIRDSTISVDNCTFRNNVVRAPGRGGAIAMILLVFIDALQTFPEYPDDVFTILKISDSEFVDNVGFVGGAVFLHMSPVNVTNYGIVFDTVAFVGNIAATGSAVLANSIPTLFIQKSNEIVFKDVTVRNNTFPTTLLTTTSTIDNSAAFMLTRVNNIIISGRNDTQGSVFSYNSPGAVLVAGGKLFVNGSIEFSDNTAFRGGALALFDYTILHIMEGSRITFKRNHALQTGGAIFANSLGTGLLTDICAFQFIGENRISTASEVGLLDLRLTFEANSADIAGNSIYASPLYNCAYLPEASTVKNVFEYREQDIYQAIFDFESSIQNGNQEITSVPDRIAFCNLSDYTTDFSLLKTNVTTIPGKQFPLILMSIDAILTPVQAIMYVELDNEKQNLGAAQSTRRLSGQNCSLIEFNVYGPENTQGNMFLYARVGGIGLTVELTLEECPPGFHLGVVDGQNQCLCDIYVLDVLQTTCNMSTFTVLRPKQIWIGTVDYREHNVSSVVWVRTCPIGHCRPNVTVVDLNVNDQICESGRSGYLCGKCKEGLSVVFGSAACMECTNYWLFSVLVYALVGLALVVFMFLLDLTVRKGTLNGLIFYVNIVSVNGNIIFSNISFVKIFISLLNLELGFPVCFYDGMDEASKIGLQFVFPIYLLLLCVVLILLTKWSSTIQKLTSCNSIAVLATLLYISYGKILRTVIDILSFATVNSEFKSHVIWLYDGNLPYFASTHIALGLVAITVALVFLIPYTLPLLFIKLVDRHSIRFKPLFDAYAGPYKDKYRYWFGLRLVILIAMCLTYAIAGTDEQPLALSIETFFLVCYTVWQAYCRPYRNRAIGILDLFFLLNFLTIAVWLLHLVNDSSSHSTLKRNSIISLLVFIAIIVSLGILVYHLYRLLTEVSTKFQKGMDKFFASARSFFTYQKLKQMKYKITKPAVKVTDESGDDKQTSQPTLLQVSHTTVCLDTLSASVNRERKQTFSSLREPMLDYAN